MKKRTAGWKSFLLTLLALVWIFAIPVLAEEGGSGDNSLSTLGITTEGVTVSPDFYYSTIEYQVTVPSGTSRLELDPVPSNSGASILGGETVIGTGAVIGSNAFITSSVPAQTRVSIKNPELQFKDRSRKASELGQEGFFNRKEED